MGEKIYIADKETVDKILGLLTSTELGLAVLKELLSDSAGIAETTSASLDAFGADLGVVKESLADSANGLGAIKAAVDGKADAETMAATKALLENATYGLNAIKSAVDGRANETTVAAVKALLENGSYGLYAILSAISGRANETTAAAIKTYLENGTYGLNALRNAIAGNLKTIKSVQRGLANITSTSNAPVSVTISPVVVAKTFVIAQPATFRLDSSGNINGGNANPFAIRLVNSTTIQMVTASSMGQMSWQAVEFY